MLDTANGGDAERLYERLGWARVGVIPGYALLPQGGLCGTTVYYRNLGGQLGPAAILATLPPGRSNIRGRAAPWRTRG